MTPDINRLRERLNALGDIADDLELEFVDDPSWAEPSDVSYLSDQDRANPDIMEALSAPLVPPRPDLRVRGRERR
jgi:hypothetical protein